jgi:hypothetical protein
MTDIAITRIKRDLDQLPHEIYQRLRTRWPVEVDAIRSGNTDQLDASEGSELADLAAAAREAREKATVGERVRALTGSTVTAALAEAIVQRYEGEDEPLTTENLDRLVEHMADNSQKLWDNKIGPLLDEIEGEPLLFGINGPGAF